MISLKDYDPCSACKYRLHNEKCPMAQKTMCPTFETIACLKRELQCGKGSVPAEFLIEILQARGWHGELKYTEVVKV